MLPEIKSILRYQNMAPYKSQGVLSNAYSCRRFQVNSTVMETIVHTDHRTDKMRERKTFAKEDFGIHRCSH